LSTGEIDLQASGPGSYVIKYVTTGLCPASSQVIITVNENLDANFEQFGPFCEGEAPFQFFANNIGGIWSGPGIDPMTGLFNPSQADIGVNLISYVMTGGCGDIHSIQVEDAATPIVSTIQDTIIELGASVDLTTISSTTNLVWSPSNWLDCETCLSPVSMPEDGITYTVTAENNGCFAYDEVEILVLYDQVVFVPNIFSPNEDGINDILFVRGKGIAKVEFIVYDRWGEKVFESTSLDDGWDGIFRGLKMNPAVFVYYVEVTFINGNTASKKGDVTLIR